MLIIERLPSGLVERLSRSAKLRHALRPIANRMLPTDRTVVTVQTGPAQGIRLEIDPQLEKFYWTGSWEPQTQEALRGLLHRGERCFDVGAHVGFFALLADRLVGPGGHVIAFEPIDENRERLSRNVALNDAGVTIVGQALGRRAESAVMTMQGGMTAMWTLEPDAAGIRRSAVDVTTLDAAAALHGRPDLVKIDAEGSEIDVLRGGAELIAQNSTTFLIEFHDDAFVEAAAALLIGYVFEHLGANHWRITPPAEPLRS